MLFRSVAIISVGGNSDIEIKERKDRVEDALFATKAALAEGVVPGGGVALIRAVNAIAISSKEVSPSEVVGFDIVKKTCHAPFKTILNNCGIEDYYSILKNALDVDTFTYDAKAQSVVNAFTAGLLDPTKVTRTAIENAASVAGTILTTESVIFEKKEDSKKEDPMMGMY